MKQWKKRALSMLLAMAMVMGTVALAAGGSKTISVTPMNMTINGQEVVPTKSNGEAAEVFAYDGATYVPLRYLSELLGIEVQWDKDNPNTAVLVNVPNFTAPGGDGTYTGTGSGFGGDVTVTVTMAGGKVTDCTVTGDKETPAIGGAALATLADQIKATGAVDGVSGATMTSNGAKEALAAALASAKGATAASGDLAFTAGTYEGTATGYNAPVTLAVTFSDKAVTKVEIVKEGETAHVGTPAYDIMFADIVAANGTGVDAVAGATFTSRAIKEAVNAAAEQAKATNMTAFKSNTVKHTAQAPIEGTWDVIVVGAGGAGMAAAAQAAQNGSTVLVLEKATAMGGNTLVAGGSYQECRPYLVWEEKNPEATEGVSPNDGQSYPKIKADAGRLDTLKTILTWSEKPFDGTVDADHPFVAGDIALNAVRGVHPEYLPTLKTLKKQIQAYVTWADKKLAAGAKETDLTLFSTLELHIFQTYYGGLRPSADNTEWIYSKFELVDQFIREGQNLDKWLMDQGAIVPQSNQNTLIGCLWQRTNPAMTGVVDGVTYEAKWGGYFKVPENTMRKANAKNDILYRTTAEELIVENGKVVGVKATQYDGTPVTVYANQGVILATGGYAANIKMVQETNKYWKPEYIADNIGTTTRIGMVGEGITMAQAVGAAVDGMGWTQMMPLGWVDNGNLSAGAGENVIFVDTNTGLRYVDESAERDVLSLGSFEHSMPMELAKELGLKQVPGIYAEFSNPTTNSRFATSNIENRVFVLTVEEAAAKLHLDAATLRKTITDYDNYVMGVTDKLDVEKLSLRDTIGDVEKDDKGNYKPETYKLDKVIMRFMAPSTHHTMGGLVVDTERHVLDESGKAISGLWAAGEVTSGFMAGNRLGGNAITEILVSGRTAANSVTGK